MRNIAVRSPWIGVFAFSWSVLASAASVAGDSGGMALAGFAEVDITPPLGVAMGGRGCSDEISTDVIDPLFAHATVLRDAAGAGLAIVSFDLIGLGRTFSDRLRADVARRIGIPEDCVIFNFSHTHSGPMMYREYIAACGEPNDVERRYFVELARKTLDVCSKAAAGLAPAVAEVYEGTSDMGIHRRGRSPDDTFSRVPDPKGPYDPTVWILRFATPEAKTRAVVFSYACHAVTVYGHAKTSLSADYPGVCRREIRAALDPDVHVQFLQGPGGNVRPRCTADLATGVFQMAVPHAKETAGRELATAVLAGLKRPGRPISLRLAAHSARIDLPRGEPPPKTFYEEVVRTKTDYTARAARYWLEQYKQGGPSQKTVSWVVGVVRLAPDQWICWFSGEPVVQWATYARRWFGGRPVVTLGYCQELFGYLPVDEVLDQGGYEVRSSNYNRPGNPAPFARGLNERIRKCVADCLAGMDPATTRQASDAFFR